MTFDPYHVWLGIPPELQPPNHYGLLGLRDFEENADVIESAADRQMAHLRSFQGGPRAELSQTLLNELSEARICLLDRDRKATYDAQLKAAPLTRTDRGASNAAEKDFASIPHRRSAGTVALLIGGSIAGLAGIFLLLKFAIGGFGQNPEPGGQEKVEAKKPTSGRPSVPAVKKTPVEKTPTNKKTSVEKAPVKKATAGKVAGKQGLPFDGPAKWIWVPPSAPLPRTPSDDRKKGVDETAVFRRRFSLARLPKRAVLATTADNRYTAFINGKRVASDGNWKTLETTSVGDALKVGANEILIFVTNFVSAVNRAGLYVDLRGEFEDGWKSVSASDERWECGGAGKGDSGKPIWKTVIPTRVEALSGTKLTVEPDGTIRATKSTGKNIYTLVTKTLGQTRINGFRLDVLPDPALPGGGPGYGSNGNFVLTEIQVALIAPSGTVKPIQVRSVWATVEQLPRPRFPERYDAKLAVDGIVNNKTGWAIWPETGKPQALILEFARTKYFTPNVQLKVTLHHNRSTNTLGRFRLSRTWAEPALLRASSERPSTHVEWKPAVLIQDAFADVHPHIKDFNTAISNGSYRMPVADKKDGKKTQKDVAQEKGGGKKVGSQKKVSTEAPSPTKVVKAAKKSPSVEKTPTAKKAATVKKSLKKSAPLVKKTARGSRRAGMIGRALIAGRDAGSVLHYLPGKRLPQSKLFKEFQVEKGAKVEVRLLGMFVLRRPTTVRIRHKGGSSNGGVLRLFLNGKEATSVGDDRSKDQTVNLPLTAGQHTVGWTLSGGVLGDGNMIHLSDAKNGRELEVVFSRQMLSQARKMPTRRQVSVSE